MIRKFLSAGSMAIAASVSCHTAGAVEVDTDVVFVVDNSGSMGGELNFLAGAIGGFLSDLQADARIGTARAGLITYNNDPQLVSGLTSDATALSAAFSGVALGGGTENAYRAVDSAVPGQTLDFGLDYNPNAVKSVVLITDEDADDDLTYTNSFGTGELALAAHLQDAGFLNNIIHRLGSPDTDDYDGIARPETGLFDIVAFRDNREGFFNEFTRTKIAEITDPGVPVDPEPPVDPGSPVTPIPVPATLPLLLSGLLGVGLLGWRRRSAQA